MPRPPLACSFALDLPTVSGYLRRVSGMAAARELVLLGARLYLKDLPFLADSGYGGAGTGVLVPVKGPAAVSSILTRKSATRCCAPSATRANAASPR